MSGGEQQRVAVARALMNDPAIIFADEPSGNLDSQNAASLHQLFFDLRDELNQTFVIVTHNKELAAMADRTIALVDGKVAHDKAEIKAFLDEKAAVYESLDFIAADPIQIPHSFSKKEDIEISGFLAATIAWGNRKSIINNAKK